MVRGDSMILTFDLPPLSFNQGQCDIDRVQSMIRHTQMKIEKHGLVLLRVSDLLERRRGSTLVLLLL